MLLAQQPNWEKREGEMQRAAAPPTMDESLSEEENQMKMVEQIETQRDFTRKQGRTPPVITLPLLDHMIPYAVRFKTRKEYPSVLEMYRQFKRNRVNDGKNAFSMRHIAAADSFPGVEVNPKLGWLRSLYLYATRVFQAQSLKSNAWVAPMRQEVLEQYIQLNEAITKGNTKRIADLTMPPFTAEATALAERATPDTLYRWAFHREVSPTRILSLRAGDGEFGKVMPETGSRVAVQALVRFDTEQSVEMYDPAGRALHTPAPSYTNTTAAPHQSQSQAQRRGQLQIVPAVPRRVTEYLVVDKAFYDPNGRWRFRARVGVEGGRTVGV
ncbi:hypothetical protein B0H14DRAFT_2686438 [Mycena olivaceomarginata]|nr:hypothetical protein B0H14DRAFT_2686438 [Mycena olivaceomarginata]